jgi:hypothetical protein
MICCCGDDPVEGVTVVPIHCRRLQGDNGRQRRNPAPLFVEQHRQAFDKRLHFAPFAQSHFPPDLKQRNRAHVDT